MKTNRTAALLGGLQLVGLGASPTDPTLLTARVAPAGTDRTDTRAIEAGALRAAEAAHLEVYAGCKWGKFSFDPVRVESEPIPADLLALHAQLT